MDKEVCQKEVAKLKRYLKDFPWLWRIRDVWCHLVVEVRVRYASAGDLWTDVVPVGRAPRVTLWFKVTEKKQGEESDKITDYEPHYSCNLRSAILNFKLTYPERKVEYVILVYDKSNTKDGKEIIVILRPPKPKKFW